LIKRLGILSLIFFYFYGEGITLMFGGFLREESGQGAIEYILLAGGIVVVTIMIFAIYSQMVETSGGAAESIHRECYK
jgi:Flp pilus assembly pilin Flp